MGARASSGRIHEGTELVEQVYRVVRAGGGFGMVLDAEGGAVEQPDALDYAVVEVDVAHYRLAEGGAEWLAGARGYVGPLCCPPGGRPPRLGGLPVPPVP